MYALRLAFGSALMAFSTLVNHCSGLEPVVPTPLVTPNSVNAETLPLASARSAIMPRSLTRPSRNAAEPVLS